MILSAGDWLVIALYGVALAIFGFVLTRKFKTAESYFLAGRNLTWPFIGASLFAANISAEHLVGLAGSGYASGMAVGGFEWMAVFCLVPLILIFLPFYIRNKIFTVPEFLERRFDRRIRFCFSAFMIILSILVKISISLWASALVFEQLLGWNRSAVIWGMGIITALYTMKGGLRAVVYTDALQSAILIVAAIILTSIGLHHIGGWSGLHAKLGPEMFHMVKPATDPDYPWFGMFFGVFVVGSFYWSMDQVLVQRAFAAKNLEEGRLGAIFCGFLKLTTPFLLVLPGLIAHALYPDLSKSDDAYPTLLRNLMPHGLLGLTMAGITAALMGHISATYNSIATLVTRDFYLQVRPAATQDEQVRVGRISVLSVFIFGALWAPMIGSFGGLWTYLQSVQAYLMMPFAGIFFAGVLWKRTTTTGVIACLITACVVCPTLMFDNQRHFLPFLNYPLLRPWLHTSLIAFAISMVVLVVVSCRTKATSADQLQTTTVSNWKSLLHSDATTLRRNYLPWLCLLLGICISFWIIMR